MKNSAAVAGGVNIGIAGAQIGVHLNAVADGQTHLPGEIDVRLDAQPRHHGIGDDLLFAAVLEITRF